MFKIGNCKSALGRPFLRKEFGALQDCASVSHLCGEADCGVKGKSEKWVENGGLLEGVIFLSASTLLDQISFLNSIWHLQESSGHKNVDVENERCLKASNI